MDHFHRLRIGRIADRFADRYIGNSRYDGNIPAFGFIHRNPFQSAVNEDLIDLSLNDLAVLLRYSDGSVSEDLDL